MTSLDQDGGGRSRDDVLAGEYVLGVLSLKDRRIVEERIRSDGQFAALVTRWEANLSPLNEEYEEIAPGMQSFEGIETRLFGAPEPAPTFLTGLWNSAVFWRSLTFASLVIAVGAIVFASGIVPQPQAPAQLVAELSAADSQVNLLASYDEQSGRLRIVPVAAGRPQEKSLQLWLVPGGGAPKSLGIFEPGKSGELIIPEALRSDIGEGATLAVSLEPFGGSPTGLPTGPVVASGATRRP